MLLKGQRFIRLKEQIPFRSNELVPPESYLQTTDGSLSSGPFRIEVDHNGFIKSGNKIGASPLPVVVLGGSFVESSYAHERERFVSAAEQKLIEQRHDVQLLNGGYSGTTALQMLSALPTKVYPVVGSTGLVILFGPQSDVNALQMEGGYWSTHERYRALVPASEPVAADLAVGSEAVRKVYSAIVGVADAMNMRLVLATSPFRIGDFNTDATLRKAYLRSRDRYESFLKERKMLSTVLRQVAVTTDTPLIDGDTFIGGNPQCFYDEMHFNAYGQSTFGKFFAEKIKEFLPDS